MLQRIPLVRSVYGGVKGFTESVFSQDNTFRKVVMIQYPRLGIWTIGFVTSDNMREISAKTGQQQVCVYVPTTPNPTSGFIVIVPHGGGDGAQHERGCGHEDDHHLRRGGTAELRAAPTAEIA